jgi:vacuolar-type H+-ATPase subunit E/Vma4
VRVITGLDDIELSASVSGTLQSPSISVRSNLDRILADRVRGVLGEEVARAEQEARAQVERIVRERAAPIQAEAQRVRDEAEQRITEARTRIDETRAELEGRLRGLGVR